MCRQKRIPPLAAVLLFLVAASHGGVQLGQGRVAEKPVVQGEDIDTREAATLVSRERSGAGNRQELNIGDPNGQIIVEQVVQKQTGVGNRQSLNLGATD